jgi:hypothetical protein
MKKYVIFLLGFLAGTAVTIATIYIIIRLSRLNDRLSGLTLFSKQGECLTTTSKSKSSEIEIFQVLEPSVALCNIKYYTDEKMYGGETYRNYDMRNEVVVLLTNNEGKSYYDNQKEDITHKCARQIGTYQYKATSGLEKTVPVIILE